MMHLAVVPPAQRHGELITDLSAQRLMLRKPKMMRVRRSAAANQAWLFSYEPEVFLVTRAARRHPREMTIFVIFLICRISRRQGRLVEIGTVLRRRRRCRGGYLAELSLTLQFFQPCFERDLYLPRVSCV